MPITQSAKKALRQSKTRKKRNLKYKDKIKTLMKRALAFAKEKNQEELKKILPKFYKAVDKAAKVGVIKKNPASRRKSVVAKKLNPKPAPEAKNTPKN